jgi:hypothetical protein
MLDHGVSAHVQVRTTVCGCLSDGDGGGWGWGWGWGGVRMPSAVHSLVWICGKRMLIPTTDPPQTCYGWEAWLRRNGVQRPIQARVGIGGFTLRDADLQLTICFDEFAHDEPRVQEGGVRSGGALAETLEKLVG